MSIQAIVDVLDSVDQLHCSLLELGELKRQAIVANQVDELNRIVSKETKISKQISERDKLRVDAVSAFLKSKDYNANASITISDLTRIVFKVDEKQALLDAQQRLTGTILKLRKLNDLNQQLIQQSLFYIDFSLDLLAGAPEQEAFYQNPAKQSHGMKTRGYFDART